MSDYERYGDYNDIEEPRKSGAFLLTLKIITALICIGVVSLIAFRLIIFNSYPESVSRLYFNDTLTAHYNERGGDISVKTQNLRAPYDDPDLGNFFCEYLYVIEDIDQLQISMRYNTGNLERIGKSAGLSYTPDFESTDAFSFRLVDNYGNIYDDVEVALTDSSLMYRYLKLVIDGVELSPNQNGEFPEWIRLEIFVVGQPSAEPCGMVAIYENNEDFSDFSEYELSSEDKPANE